MRRFAPLGLIVLLSGCSGSGFGTFLSDTVPFAGPANAPISNSENMRRVRSQSADVSPLQPEPGNVWPPPPPPEPTLSDIERQTSPLPPPNMTPYPGPGSSTPPGSPPAAPVPSPVPGTVPNADRGSAPALSQGAAPPGRGSVLTTPRGPAVNTGGTSRYQTYGAPAGSNAGGIMVPNGNGTSTLVAPDGSVSTVPTPK